MSSPTGRVITDWPAALVPYRYRLGCDSDRILRRRWILVKDRMLRHQTEG